MTGKLRTHVLCAGVGLAIAAAVLLAAREPEAAPPNPPVLDEPAPPQDCAGGCSAAAPSETTLGEAKLSELLGSLNDTPAGTDCPALDEILFAGEEAATFLDSHPSAVKASWIPFLRSELSRRNVRVRVDVAGIDEATRIRVDHVVRLGTRTHVAPDLTRGLTPPEVTLTVRRVGLHHLWTRL